MPDQKTVILCIDDDPDILSFLQIVLEGAGYTFVAAESAEAGLRAYRESAPDAVIVDLMMEEVDSGTGFVRELRALGNRAPVFMLSSVGDNLNLVDRLHAARPRRRLPEAAGAAAPAVGARGGARRRASGLSGVAGASEPRALRPAPAPTPPVPAG